VLEETPEHMKDRIREAVGRGGLSGRVRSLVERGRVLKRLLRPARAIPLHRDEPIEPFFIVGSGRCGTTLLRRLSMASDEVHIPPENWKLSDVVTAFRRYRWVLTWKELVRLVSIRFARQGTHHEGSANRWFEADALYPVIDELASLPESEKSLARLVDGLYRHHGREQGATFTRWGDKTPLNVKWMPAIRETFPRGKFVHLLRDGTDVVSSWLNVGLYSDIREPALRWKSAVTAARSFAEAHPSQCLEIRYEDMVRKPVEVVENVCRFLSLRFSPAMIEERSHQHEMSQATQLSHHENLFASISSEHIGKGHRRLSEEEKTEVVDLIGAELNTCEYSLPI
jgi:hypothetical protein